MVGILPRTIIFWIYYLTIMKAEDKFLEQKFQQEMGVKALTCYPKSQKLSTF